MTNARPSTQIIFYSYYFHQIDNRHLYLFFKDSLINQASFVNITDGILRRNSTQHTLIAIQRGFKITSDSKLREINEP